jgi:cytoskeleton protein RodZ
MGSEQSPGDIGSKLRCAREGRGLSLGQISRATKIPLSTLQALERNELSRLPGGIFGRGFVRSYAHEVGIDPEETVQVFLAQSPQASAAAGPSDPTQQEDDAAFERDRKMASTFVRLITISLGLVAAAWSFMAWDRQAGRSESLAVSPGPASSRASASEPRSETSPAPARTARDATQITATSGARPTSTAPVKAGPRQVDQSPGPMKAGRDTVDQAQAVSQADQLTVMLSFSGPCWISATVDGQRSVQRLFRPEEQETLDIRRELVLTAGDAAAVKMTVNGAAARPLGRAGQVVTARVNLVNFKEYLPPPSQ